MDGLKIVRELNVPTGQIYIAQGSKGLIEFLSLADYGQGVNLNQHKKVEHQSLMPLSEKWVVTISTQFGCSMNCNFCDCPKVGPGKNASYLDLTGQLLAAIRRHPEVIATKRLNIHFARMGEPSWNPNVLDCATFIKTRLYEYNPHPVVSTMMPRHNEWLGTFIRDWMRIKNEMFDGNAGLQLSINSTDEYERNVMFSGNALTLHEIAEIMYDAQLPKGRKITLNFAVCGYEIDPEALLDWFSPEHYIIKLTPMHKTQTALANDIKTSGDYTDWMPYQHHEEALKKAGYDVLVFIASKEEDAGRITCGNAILSGTKPDCEYTEKSF